MDNHIYLSANAFARMISTLADERLKMYDITTSYAFILILIYERPGIGQKEICEEYHLAPSTMTRFLDKLIKKGLIVREKDGKNVIPVLTSKGEILCPDLINEIKSLNVEIEGKLGRKYADTLNRMMAHGIQQIDSDP